MAAYIMLSIRPLACCSGIVGHVTRMAKASAVSVCGCAKGVGLEGRVKSRSRGMNARGDPISVRRFRKARHKLVLGRKAL